LEAPFSPKNTISTKRLAAQKKRDPKSGTTQARQVECQRGKGKEGEVECENGKKKEKSLD